MCRWMIYIIYTVMMQNSLTNRSFRYEHIMMLLAKLDYMLKVYGYSSSQSKQAILDRIFHNKVNLDEIEDSFQEMITNQIPQMSSSIQYGLIKDIQLQIINLRQDDEEDDEFKLSVAKRVRTFSILSFINSIQQKQVHHSKPQSTICQPQQSLEKAKINPAHVSKTNTLEKPSVFKQEANRSETILDKLQNSWGESNRSAFKLVKQGPAESSSSCSSKQFSSSSENSQDSHIEIDRDDMQDQGQEQSRTSARFEQTSFFQSSAESQQSEQSDHDMQDEQVSNQSQSQPEDDSPITEY